MNPAEEYILNQPEPFCSMLMHLQGVIEHIFPEIDLKYKYRIPFYYIDGKPFCYLNQSKDYVDLGIWKGAYITQHQEYLTGGRRVIRSLRYTSLEAIDNEILVAILREAYSIKDKKFYG